MEPTEAYLWRLVGEGTAHEYRAAQGYEAHLLPHASLILSGEPAFGVNWAIIDQAPQAEQQLDEFVQVIRARKLPTSLLLSSSIADRLAPMALRLGLRHTGQMPLMTYRPQICTTEHAPSQVELVDNDIGLWEATEVIASGFGGLSEAVHRIFGPLLLDVPAVTIFLIRHLNEPISTVWTVRAGTIVYIGLMATVPEHQRKGVGHAILQHAISYHSQQGATLFHLCASKAGMPLYTRVGFRTVTEAGVWEVD